MPAGSPRPLDGSWTSQWLNRHGPYVVSKLLS